MEFPHRFHDTELHTGLKSYERLPRWLRNFILLTLSGPFSQLDEKTKAKYYSIYSTGLQQVSIGRVKRWIGENGRMLHYVEVRPGIMRCLIHKMPNPDKTHFIPKVEEWRQER